MQELNHADGVFFNDWNASCAHTERTPCMCPQQPWKRTQTSVRFRSFPPWQVSDIFRLHDKLNKNQPLEYCVLLLYFHFMYWGTHTHIHTQNKLGKKPIRHAVLLKQPFKACYLDVTEISSHGFSLNSRNKWRIIYNPRQGFCSFSVVLLWKERVMKADSRNSTAARSKQPYLYSPCTSQKIEKPTCWMELLTLTYVICWWHANYDFLENWWSLNFLGFL